MNKALFILLLFALNGLGATYYVSISGSDTSGSGGAASPWRTMQHAHDVATSGDTVLVQPGIYDEFVSIGRAGITFRANGSVTNKSTFYVHASNTTIDGFHMTMQGSYGAYAAVYFPSGSVTNGWIINNFCHDTPDGAPAGNGLTQFDNVAGRSTVTGIIISNNMVYDVGGPGIYVNGVRHQIVNNYISNTFSCNAFYFIGQDHTFKGNRIYAVSSEFVRVTGCGNTNFNGPYTLDPAYLHQSIFGHTTWTNIHGYFLVFDETKVTNRFAIYDYHTNAYACAPAYGGPWVALGTNIISPPTLCVGGVMEHPDLIQTIGPGLAPAATYDQVSSNILFEGNYAYGGVGSAIGSGIEGYPMPPTYTNYAVCDWIIRNNVFVRFEKGLDIAAPRIKLFNNTFYECCWFGDSSPIGLSFYSLLSADMRGQAYDCQIRNNAFIACGGRSGLGWYGVGYAPDGYIPNPPMNLWTNCDYNYVSGTNGMSKDQGTDYPSPNGAGSIWRFYEPHGINGGNAKLHTVGSSLDLTPLPGSVLIDAGQSGLVTNSFNGIARSGSIDIGAYEWDSSLKLWLDFDQTNSSGRVLDISGNTNNAWACESTNIIGTSNGVFGSSGGYFFTNSTLLDPPTTLIPVGQSLGITNLSGIKYLTNCTISAWVQFRENSTAVYTWVLGSGYDAVYMADHAATNGWDLLKNGGTFMSMITYPAAGGTANLLIWPTATGSTYHHYVAAVNCTSNQAIAYYDGSPVHTNTVDLPYLRIYGNPTVNWLCIGRMPHQLGPTELSGAYGYAAGFFEGFMDEIRIYNRVMNRSEVNNLYSGLMQASVSSSEPGGETNAPVVLRGFHANTLRVGTVIKK